MRGWLLDTNVVLLATFEPEQLSEAIRTAVETGPVFLSTVSFWEVVLKSMKRKLDVGDPRSWWRTAIDDLAATPLMLAPEHVAEICNLPAFHSDPFDRALIAQAVVADLTFATTDALIGGYVSESFHVVR